MQIAARINRFLIDTFSFKPWHELQKQTEQAGFYQQFTSELIKGIHTKQAVIDLGHRLITLADHAYAVRRADAVEQAGQMLLNLPLPCGYEKIGRYYQALAIKRYGKFAEARALLERIASAEDAPLRYRARAMLTTGTIFYESGNFESALPFYLEANRAAAYDRCDPLSIVGAQRMIAVLKSINGDHRGALADLKDQLPLARLVGSVYPHDYCIHLNSLAVESAEADHLEEAEHYCRIALASPYASAYPEYRETRYDIELRGRRASRSVVSFTQSAVKTENLLRLPVPDLNDSTGSDASCLSSPQQPARVLSYEKWKNKMVKEPNGDQKNDKPFQQLDDRQMLLKIVELSTIKGLPDEALQEMVDSLEKIVARYTKKDDKND